MVKRKLNIIKLLNGKDSFFLFGPRGSGKSSLVSSALSKLKTPILKLDLLHSDTSRRYLLHPEFLRKEVSELCRQAPRDFLRVFIDEIQKIPALLDEVHWLIENHPGRVQFILTGSSARKLKRAGANLLAGRASTFNLHPFSSEEVDFDISSVLRFGSLPKPFTNPKGARRFLSAYVNTYLKEEIQQEAIVRRLEPFMRFLDLAGQFNGVPVKESRLAGQLGISPNTVKEYFSILTETLIAHRIEPWGYSVIKQLQRSPRHYLFDCGVLNALSGELDAAPREGTYRYGKLFETFIVNELIRCNDYNELGFKFFCYRTDSGTEVDIIAARGPFDTPRAIEIKSSSTPDQNDLKGLRLLRNNIPKAKLFCLCSTPRAYEQDGVRVLPWKGGIKTVLSSL